MIAINVVAQLQQPQVALYNYLQQKSAAGAAKTTYTGGRWYNYGIAMDTSQNAYNGSFMRNTALAATTIWNDTNGTVLDSGHIYHHITNVCEGAVLDPKASMFNNDPDLAFLGQMLVTGADAYVWDSVELFGTYLYNATKITEVDTLRLVFMTGFGGAIASDNIFADTVGLGHYHGSIHLNMQYDSLHNVGIGNNPTNLFPATIPHYMDILLDNTTWNDTLPGGIWHKTIAVNGSSGISAGAGHFCGMTLTYISGDVVTHTGILSTPTPGDTLVGTWHGWGNSKYNVWCPLVNYYATYSGSSPTAAWAPHQCPAYEPNPVDNNLGYWKKLPNGLFGWKDKFLPTWAWASGAGASVLQYPFISWHVVCSTCSIIYLPPDLVNEIAIINTVKAYPDPSNEELNISFDIAKVSNITVSLTNMIGQVVATQKINDKAAGNVVFNTAMLPDGVYIYTLLVNGTVTTGRVAVAH
jgi:hypothetical protein